MSSPAPKQILITGGTGYVGSLLLRHLKRFAERAPISVTVLSRNPARFKQARPELLWDGLSFIEGDIADFRFSAPLPSFDAIVHGGNPAENPSGVEEEKKFRNTTIDGTRNLLEQIDSLAAPPKKLLLLSSGAVHSRASNVYAEAKAESEDLLVGHAAKTGLSVAVARIFACAGPYLPLEGRFALGQFIRGARDSGEISIRSDGKALRSYLFGDELAEWLTTILLSNGNHAGPEIYDIGSDDPIRISEVAEAVAGVFAARGRPVTVRTEGASPSGPDYLPDLMPFTRAYGLKPKKSSIQAIQETTEWVIRHARAGG